MDIGLKINVKSGNWENFRTISQARRIKVFGEMIRHRDDFMFSVVLKFMNDIFSNIVCILSSFLFLQLLKFGKER